MTVTYTAHVATASPACFLRLLLRWRASIYKLLWKEFLLFATCYFILSFVYRFALNADQKHIFEQVALYCDAFNNLIPVAFVLGFYVTLAFGRWWDQFNQIPWPDRLSLFVTAHIHGHDERGRVMRRTLMRYVCLSYLITMSSICLPVKKRFPNFTKMTEAGFMLASEQKIIENIKASFNKYFVPLVWSTSIITRARKEGRIKDDFAVKTLMDEINAFRGMLGALFNYDWISIPLVYTQVVTLAVYMFFISCLMGRQFLENDGDTPDVYFPLFTFLQFFFYMGWLKVAEVLVNPFGEDDDDFDINALIDRNLQLSYLVVDEMHSEHPELIKDAYWDEQEFDLPYTVASESFRPTSPFLGSAMNVEVQPHETEFVQLASVAEEPASPQPIPTVKARPMRKSSHLANNPFHRLKRTLSKESRSDASNQTLNLPYRIHHKRVESLSSHGSVDQYNLYNQPSPTTTMRTVSSQSIDQQRQNPTSQEDIFAMSDIDEPLEDELDNLLDAALAETEPEKQKQLLKQLAIHRANSQRSVRSNRSNAEKEANEKDCCSLTGSRSVLKEGPQETLPPIKEGVAQSQSDHTDSCPESPPDTDATPKVNEN